MSMIINPFRFGAPPPSIFATNWRLLVTKTAYTEFTSITSCQIAEIEMRQSAGGADECTGGTASAVSGGTPGSAFDNTLSTSWRGETVPSCAIQYAHTSSKGIVEVAVTSPSNSDFMGDCPTEFKLQTNDGSAVDVFTFKTGPWGVGETRIFNINSFVDEPKKFIRVRPTGMQGGSQVWIVPTIEFRTTSGGANVATGGTPICYEYNGSSRVPANAFDGNSATWYESFNAGSSARQYLGYNFPTAIADTVVEIALTCLNQSFGPNCCPTGFHVEYGSGNTWTNIWTVSGISTWTQGETKVFTKP
jgi:hypothetical protein